MFTKCNPVLLNLTRPSNSTKSAKHINYLNGPLGQSPRKEGSALCTLFHGNPPSSTTFIAIPNIIFFPNPHPCPAQVLANSDSGNSFTGKIPYPVNVFLNWNWHWIVGKSLLPEYTSRSFKSNDCYKVSMFLFKGNFKQIPEI